MRNKIFSRKLRSILSITLSLVMLIGACFVVPVATVSAENTPVLEIDFENHTEHDMSSIFAVSSAPVAEGDDKDRGKALGDVHGSGYDGGKKFVEINKGGTGSCGYGTGKCSCTNNERISLSAGLYYVDYEYYFDDDDGHTSKVDTDNFSFKFASSTDSKFGDELIDTTKEKGKWHSARMEISLNRKITQFGLQLEHSPYHIYVDNIKFTPVDVISQYAEDHCTFSTFNDTNTTTGLRDTMNANQKYISGNVFNYRNELFTNATVDNNSVLAVLLWNGARHMRLNDTAQGLALHAGRKYTLTFKWLNPNPEKDGVVGNESINKGTSDYDKDAYVKLIANAGKFAATEYSTLATLLDVKDFSSIEGNTGEFVSKSVTFTIPYGTDITDIAISTISSDGPAAKDADKYDDYIFLDDFKFTCEEITFVEPITINFENETLDGSGYFEIKSVNNANGESTNAFCGKYVSEAARFSRFQKDSKNISLVMEGTYKFEYSYFISEDASQNLSNSILKFAETIDISKPYWDNGSEIGENIILPNSQKGVWIKSSQYITLSEPLSALGIFATKTPTYIYLDDIKITKVEGFNIYNFSDGSTQTVEYVSGITAPEDNALNFSHWVDSKGTTVAVGAPVEKNETYTAVLNNKITYDFADFKDTEVAQKTKDGSICVKVEPSTDTSVEVPIETDSGKKIVLNKNSGYLVRANYKSMSDKGEDGTGAAGYVAEWWDPKNPISAKRGNFPEIRISISSAGYATGGIALEDTDDYVTTKWTYIETGNSEHSLKLSFSAKNANLSEVYVKSIEIVAFDLEAAQSNTNVINTTVEMFYNGTNEEVKINTKNKTSDIFDLDMPAMSAVYTYTDGTQRSLMRFVTNYAYANDDITQLKISDEFSLPIYKRRVVVGKEGSEKNSYGIIETDYRIFAINEKPVNDDKTCWKIDKENDVISHSLMLKNIKEGNKEKIYEIQSYLLLDIVDGRKYSPWIVLGGNFNYLRFVEPTAPVSAQMVYNELSANVSGIDWYND